MDLIKRNALANDLGNTFFANGFSWDANERWNLTYHISDKQRNFYWAVELSSRKEGSEEATKDLQEFKRSLIYKFIRQYRYANKLD